MKRYLGLLMALLMLLCACAAPAQVEQQEETVVQEETVQEVPEQAEELTEETAEEATQEIAEQTQENISVADTGYEGDGFYGFPIMRFEVAEQQEVDLDGCGQPEIAALLKLFDEHDQMCYALRVVKGDAVYDTSYLYTWHVGLWIKDLSGDGLPEIYVSGDMMSSDYVTFGWKLTQNGLQSLSEDARGVLTNGRIASVGENSVIIEEYQYVLGTWMASREYVSSELRGLEPQVSTLWTIEQSDGERYLSVIEPLPVTVDGASALLPAGTQLTITAYDGENTVWFETADGLEGCIHLQDSNILPDGVFAMWAIDGRSENDFFEMLPYAG